MYEQRRDAFFQPEACRVCASPELDLRLIRHGACFKEFPKKYLSYCWRRMMAKYKSDNQSMT